MLAGTDRAASHAVKLDYLQVTAGTGVRNVASIGLDIAGQKFEDSATGNGPVDAAIKALKRIIHKLMVIIEFSYRPSTGAPTTWARCTCRWNTTATSTTASVPTPTSWPHQCRHTSTASTSSDNLS